MTINSTTRRTANLVGNGNTHTYPFDFKVFQDSEIVVKKLEVSTSIETTLTLGENNDYIVDLEDDQNGNPGGSITLKQGGNNFNLPSGFQIVITSNVQSLQGTDLTNQGGFYPEVINDALDKSAILHQQQQDELDRSIKFSLTNTIGSLEITENANARKNRVLGFDNLGEFEILKELGTYRGDWAASTAYAVRDLVKDTSTNNIFFCNTAHTSSGSQPLTTNTNSANWDLIVDAAAATTSANNAASSATAAANSATAAGNSATAAASSQSAAAASASAASTSETNANTYKNAAQAAQAAAETALDSFDDRYLGAKQSNPTLDNDGNALIDGALYFNTTSNIMRVYDLGNTTWLDLNITGTNLTNTNIVAGSINNVNTVGNNIANVNAAANNETNINSAVSNASNINSAVSNASNINTVAGISANVSTVAGIASNVTTVANDQADIGTVAGISNDVTTVANNNANITTVAGNNNNVTTVATNNANVTTVANDIANVNTTAGSINNVNTTAGSISSVNTVASNITNVAAAGANVVDINNFADIYQISSSPPQYRADNSQLQEGDLWFDNSNDNLRVWDGTNWNIITPAQSVLDDISIVSGAITYAEDLGLITDAVATGSSNGSLDIVADVLEDEITLTVTAATGKFIIDGVDKPALTLYKGWTYTFDVSDASNANHPLRFSSGGSPYNTGVVVTGTQGQAGAKVQLVVPETQPTTFAYYCTQHSGMGNTITVKDDPLKTVSDNVTNIVAVANNSSNINAVQSNASNINAAVSNASNINAAVSNATNITTVATNSTNINSVAGSIANVNTVSGSINNVNTFVNVYTISQNAPNSPSSGDLWYDSTNNVLKNYNGSAWIAITASSGIANVVDDTTPQLGGDLDGQNNDLTNIGTINGVNLQLDFGTI